MNKSRLIALAVFLGVATCVSRAQLTIDKNRTQGPEQQLGFGINNAGLHIQYSMGHAFHLGINLNLDVNNADAAKPDVYHFGPYAKFIFSGDVINPYLFGAVGIIKPGTGKFGIQSRYQQSDSVFVKLPETEFSIKLAAGAEHFFSRNLGVYGHVNYFNLVLYPAPTRLDFGLIGGVMGAEFFF